MSDGIEHGHQYNADKSLMAKTSDKPMTNAPIPELPEKPRELRSCVSGYLGAAYYDEAEVRPWLDYAENLRRDLVRVLRERDELRSALKEMAALHQTAVEYTPQAETLAWNRAIEHCLAICAEVYRPNCESSVDLTLAEQRIRALIQSDVERKDGRVK
jgi:hypothetical protein